MEDSRRVLGVDPGEVRIGIAISDATGTIANPLTIIRHVSRKLDAAAIAQIAAEREVELIIVGQALDVDSNPNPAGRRAGRLAEAIREQTTIPVRMWDESGSTREARLAGRHLGVGRSRWQGHMDDIAATVILQSYLDDCLENRNANMDEEKK